MEFVGFSGRKLGGSSLCNKRLSSLRDAKCSPCARGVGQLPQLLVALFRGDYWHVAWRSCRDRTIDKRTNRELQPVVDCCLALPGRFVTPAAILPVRAGHIRAALRSPPNIRKLIQIVDIAGKCKVLCCPPPGMTA